MLVENEAEVDDTLVLAPSPLLLGVTVGVGSVGGTSGVALGTESCPAKAAGDLSAAAAGDVSPELNDVTRPPTAGDLSAAAAGDVSPELNDVVRPPTAGDCRPELNAVVVRAATAGEASPELNGEARAPTAGEVSPELNEDVVPTAGDVSPDLNVVVLAPTAGDVSPELNDELPAATAGDVSPELYEGACAPTAGLRRLTPNMEPLAAAAGERHVLAAPPSADAPVGVAVADEPPLKYPER